MNCSKRTIWIYSVWKGLLWFRCKNAGFKWGGRWHLLHNQQNTVFVEFGSDNIPIIRTLDNLPQELVSHSIIQSLFSWFWIYREMQVNCPKKIDLSQNKKGKIHFFFVWRKIYFIESKSLTYEIEWFVDVAKILPENHEFLYSQREKMKNYIHFMNDEVENAHTQRNRFQF